MIRVRVSGAASLELCKQEGVRLWCTMSHELFAARGRSAYRSSTVPLTVPLT